MKYFNPSYWFKLWILSAPLFNDKTQGINAKSIDNKKIKDWASNNTNDISLIENQQLNFTNSNITNQPYNLLSQVTNQSINPFYQTDLETSTHKHRHEKNRNRVKKEINGGNELFLENRWFASPILHCAFTPDFWEKTIILKSEKNNANDFGWGFLNLVVSNGFGLASGIEGWGIWNKWEEINNVWKYSNKKKRLNIIFIHHTTADGRVLEYDKTWMLESDTINYPNKYLDNLQRDFANYDNPEINLGIINNNYENDIKNAIKEKYQNFDISQIEIVEKNDYSHFSQDYSFKIKIKDSSEKYSHGILKPKFSYVTQSKLNEISNYIANDSKVKQWIEHINDYNKNLPTKIEYLKSYTDSQKWSAKNTEKEIIKGYIRNWSYVHTLIEHELKLDELNKNIQGLKSSFDSIKNQVNDLDERVKDLEQPNHCESKGYVISGVSGVVALAPIPVLQQVAVVESQQFQEQLLLFVVYKSINHEQHLPIDNKTNFVSSNITSL